MRMVQIITDSSALITRAEGKELGIEVVPLSVNIMDEDFRDLEVDLDHFYGQIAKGGVPRSSQPPIGEFVEAYNKYAGQKIVNVAMADGLSGTWLTGCGAKEIVENKDDNNFKFICFDTVDELIELAKKEVVRLDYRDSGEKKKFNACFGGYGEPRRQVQILIDAIMTKLEDCGYGLYGHSI